MRRGPFTSTFSALVAVAVAIAFLAATASAAPSRVGAIPGCAVGSLNLLESGKLTIGADNPAYPPWFGGAEKKPWKVSDPYSGKGYESAVAYAIAKELGFTRAQVEWKAVPFNNSYRPGDKPFDFYITQVSYTPERAKAVTFSKGYYFVNQAVVARKGTKLAKVKSFSVLGDYKLGAQIGTTSFALIKNRIRPSSDPLVFDDNDKAVQALKNGQVDGIVVDLPTAFFVVAAQLDDGVIVGKVPTSQARERFGLVLEKGNSLVGCVNKAIDRLTANGTIAKLQQTWLAKAGAPDFQD